MKRLPIGSQCQPAHDASCINVKNGVQAAKCVGGLTTSSEDRIAKVGHWSTPGSEPLNLKLTRYTNQKHMDSVNHTHLYRKVWGLTCDYV